MPQMTAEAPSFEIYDADIYDTLVKEVVIEQRDPDKYHDKRYVQLAFKSHLRIRDDEDPTGFVFKPFTFWAEPKAGKSKFNKIRQAMGLPVVEADDPFTTEEMEEKYLRLTLSDKKADGSPGNRVLDYTPVKRRKVVAPPPDEDEDDDSVPF